MPGPQPSKHFGTALKISDLRSLAAELQSLRDSPPAVTSKPKKGKSPGTRIGDILGFVKGLRLSARLTYFIREVLSHEPLEVNWGQLLTSDGAACSPECDIIIHTKGHVRRWNGGEGGHSIMDFRFIAAANARVIVSCKSKLTAIDSDYPNSLKTFNVNKVLLFAECCHEVRYKKLQQQAQAAGYVGLWCLYFISKDGSCRIANEAILADFVENLTAAVTSAAGNAQAVDGTKVAR